MQRIQLSCKNFNNPEVTGGVNPHPDYGYFHAPTPGPPHTCDHRGQQEYRAPTDM
ncbi:hypothetical protein EYZ11_013141 [Aspergillus tanneri]|uniref:Uncharacterized protein n=1 Tax=Aspergillus tanneri TaxID=1220188 RepID=A0A4V3UMI0_9EURO|nr:hypothetical protein EYZ11_013141 [Aspergillus tanneri]